MEKGEVRYEGATADLLERPDLFRSVFLEGAARALEGAGGEARVSTNGHHAEAIATPAQDLLRATGIRKSFGGIAALQGVDLALARGEIVGVIGPNGAGKTTLFDVISGFVSPDRGRIELAGRDVTGWSPDRRARAGLGRSFQDARLFSSMTVNDAIALALDRHVQLKDPVSALIALPDRLVEERVIQRRVSELIDFAGLGAYANKFLSELSTGTRRIVDIVCALAHDPSALLLDEPSSGIAQKEAEALAPLIRSIRDWTGCGLLVIEHDMPLITAIADRMVALDLGLVIAAGTPDEVVRHPQVVAAYLGAGREVAGAG
jgi:branched-chain amino acid transport system ATP-binding protein